MQFHKDLSVCFTESVYIYVSKLYQTEPVQNVLKTRELSIQSKFLNKTEGDKEWNRKREREKGEERKKQ